MARNAIVPANGGPPPGRPRAAVAADVIDAEFADAPRVDLREYLRILHKYRWLAATCFGLTLALAILVTLITPRTYTATTRLQVAKQSPIQLKLAENVLSVGDDERNVAGSSSFLATQVAILKSRDLAERVIRTHRLDQSEAFRDPGSGRGGLLEVSGRLLNLLRPRGWEGPTQLAQFGEPPGAVEVAPELITTYLDYLGAAEVRGTDLVDITFSTPAPSLSAFLAAAHTQAYIEANDEARLVTNVTAKAFLGEQLREARDKIDRAEAALRAFAAEHPSVAIDQEHKVVTQRIVELSTLLTKAEGTRLAFETRYEFLTRKDADPTAYFLDAAGVQKLRLALLDLDARRASMADRIGANHPEMVALDLQRAALAKQRDAEVKREVAAVRAKHQAHELREQRLREKVEQQELAALKLQGMAARYELLKKDVGTARSLRDSLLKQQMETAVNSELTPTNVRIVDRAEVPLFAAKPNVKLNVVLGAFLGVLFAVGATLVANYFDSSVKSSEEVETLLQLPTLAVIPSFERRAPVARPAADVPAPAGARAADLVVFREPKSMVAEAFRSMRTAVLFSTPNAPPRVLVVTSAAASEGKTSTSLNLASTLAASGSRTLLIDADLRRPSCHRAFGIANDTGLSRYLAGQVELDDVIRVLDVPNLLFVPAGPTPPNPAELVGSERMRDTLERLRDDYDFVIVDSPPTLPVTDAVLLGREADGVVLVVKGNDTPRELVKRARDQLQQAGVHILGALVNNVQGGWGSLYGYGRYYGGYYGYGVGPGEAQAS
ncbi:MAG: polysaccharide biosynthesis tyrosine autokinase [bacterium]|nr:polysaccharide biosynthesis tyrosine autokinase [bacterium]